MILRWFGPEISLDRVAGVGGFGDSFGTYLLVWAVFTAFFTTAPTTSTCRRSSPSCCSRSSTLLAGIVNITAPSGSFLLNLSGWVAIADGICAWWVGFGLVLNDMGPRPIIPMPNTPGSR